MICSYAAGNTRNVFCNESKASSVRDVSLFPSCSSIHHVNSRIGVFDIQLYLGGTSLEKLHISFDQNIAEIFDCLSNAKIFSLVGKILWFEVETSQ
mmetsp:Transcript_15374/g.20647  ORF Transcript_15374/g.20647 Transcript_15374/m.20647 type:complete len:96 (-) Transcript_15374:154-441(-)